MDTDTPPDECGHTWAPPLNDRLKMFEQGISHDVIFSLEHVCVLEPEHDGTHVCACGVSS